MCSDSILIEDVVVTGLEYVGKASGYPHNSNPVFSESRLQKLGSAKVGSGHDGCIKGVIVHSTITADHSFFLQFLRYHFHDIISSTSKMHSLTNMELVFHPKTDPEVIEVFTKMRDRYTNGWITDFETLALSAPIGLMLTAATVSSYLQLKTIWHQRKNHKMSAWVEYCNWIETLPLMKDILKIEDNSGR
jgi:hypothetical protein